jgi:hypothetical protein
MFTKRLLSSTAAAAVAAVVVLPAAAHAHEPGAGRGPHPGDPHGGPGETMTQTDDLLEEVRRATVEFHDVEAAEAAGYQRASDCEADPKYGAMGIHYANPQLIEDGQLDPTRPEVLVYQPTEDGELELGAVEYFQVDADQDLDTDDDRPSMFDMPFDGPMHGHNDQMPKHYDLHVWLYRDNPAGLFAMWNPDVQCPDEEAQ